MDLNIHHFDRDTAEHAYAARIREDVENGLDSGVIGTPTFFTNGMRHSGSWEMATLLPKETVAVRNE